MSNINFFALGGLDEKDKSCYVLEIDNDIFVFNVGFSLPIDSKIGIQKIIPDISWLKSNKQRIRGLFIGFPSKNNLGAFQYIYDELKGIPIYSSKLGVEIINSYFNKRNMKKVDENFNLNTNGLDTLKRVKIGSIEITPFRVSTSIPSSIGFILHSNDGDIVYIDDFILYNDKTNAFVNEIYSLHSILKKPVLLLIVGVGNASKSSGFTSPNHRTKNFYLDAISKINDSRLLVGLYDHDIHSFITLATIAKEKQIPFIIYNPVFFNVFTSMCNQNLFNTNSLSLLPIQKINELKKGIVIISASFDKFFIKLNSICKGEDEILKLKDNDIFILGTRTISGFEKNEAEIMDNFSLIDIDCNKLPKNILEMKASSEDHKFLVNILKPKYIIPTQGLYYEMIKYSNFIAETEFNVKNIIPLFNGEILVLRNGEKAPGNIEHMEVSEKFIGKQGLMTEGNNILMERKVMSEHGMIFFSILKKNRKDQNNNKSQFDWKDIGVFSNDETNVEKRLIIQNDAFSFYEKSLNDQELMNDPKLLKQTIKKFIAKQIEKFCFKTPIILVSII